jgi:hypothetical protein
MSRDCEIVSPSLNATDDKTAEQLFEKSTKLLMPYL